MVAAALSLGNGGETSADELLRDVQKHYESIRDFRADFVQTSLVASLGREEVSSGRVTVMRPGRMRWEYTQPEQRVIVVDGEVFRMWLPVERQLQIAPLTQGGVSPTAIGFLLGESDLRESFSSTRLGAERAGEVRLQLLPRDDAGFESLDVWVELQTHRLRESLVIDLFGNLTRLRFDNVRENVGVREAEFTIEVPDDTEVIDLR